MSGGGSSPTSYKIHERIRFLADDIKDRIRSMLYEHKPIRVRENHAPIPETTEVDREKSS